MEQKKSPLVPILFAVVVIQLGIIIYLLMQNNKSEEIIVLQEDKIEADSTIITAKLKELDELNLALNRAKMEIDELGQSNDTLNTQISQLQEYIKQVKSGNLKQIGKLNSKLAEYKKLLEAKDSQITSLRQANDSLNTEVSSLNKQKTEMNDSILALRNTRSELAQQVAIASVLKSENIKVTILNKKEKEFDKKFYRAKEIYKLKVTFNLADNKVARKDDKKIMFRLIEPSGNVLYDAALGGGFFTVEGKEIPYTDKRLVRFDNSRQEVKFFYLKGSDYSSGMHRVELFADGSKIGETSFEVK